MKNVIPLCFYPTRKIVLDDDPIFSDSILFKMENKFFSSYTSPQVLLNYLNKDYNPLCRQADLFEPYPTDSELSGNHHFHIPTNKLHSIVKNAFPHDISVILVDYNMPEMTGIDFLNQVKSYSFKKILITGEQDYAIGIDALNAGLIDAYIRKDDPDLLNKLNRLVNALEWKYFTDLSAFAYNLAEFDYLSNRVFIEKFEELIIENKISAFFLENKEGNFLCFSAKGKNCIAVRSKKKLQELSILANEDGASEKSIHHLERAEVIPLFGNKQYWKIPAVNWDEFLYPAHVLAEDSDLVWTMISENN